VKIVVIRELMIFRGKLLSVMNVWIGIFMPQNKNWMKIGMCRLEISMTNTKQTLYITEYKDMDRGTVHAGNYVAAPSWEKAEEVVQMAINDLLVPPTMKITGVLVEDWKVSDSGPSPYGNINFGE
jgi:hypothetical protein